MLCSRIFDLILSRRSTELFSTSRDRGLISDFIHRLSDPRNSRLLSQSKLNDVAIPRGKVTNYSRGSSSDLRQTPKFGEDGGERVSSTEDAASAAALYESRAPTKRFLDSCLSVSGVEPAPAASRWLLGALNQLLWRQQCLANSATRPQKRDRCGAGSRLLSRRWPPACLVLLRWEASNPSPASPLRHRKTLSITPLMNY